jgi:hypothetical protein
MLNSSERNLELSIKKEISDNQKTAWYKLEHRDTEMLLSRLHFIWKRIRNNKKQFAPTIRKNYYSLLAIILPYSF